MRKREGNAHHDNLETLNLIVGEGRNDVTVSTTDSWVTEDVLSC
jgi:hypothetical protein